MQVVHFDEVKYEKNRYLRTQESPGMLIGDRENETVAGKFAEKLSHYRTDGTQYEFGQQLERLLDTVHFTHSITAKCFSWPTCTHG